MKSIPSLEIMPRFFISQAGNVLVEHGMQTLPPQLIWTFADLKTGDPKT